MSIVELEWSFCVKSKYVMHGSVARKYSEDGMELHAAFALVLCDYFRL